MKVALFGGVMIGVAILLSGCDNSKDVPVTQVTPAPVQQQQPQVVYEEAPQQQPNVVIVQQPPVYGGGYHSGIGTHLAAGALGYLAGRHSNSGSYTRRSEVHHYYHSAPSRRSYGSRGRRR